jgi:uncharacterized damage-inducible protein DinB
LEVKGYLYAAEMTDMLTTIMDKKDWDKVLVPELGSLARLFAHMIRVRGVYRNALLTGIVQFPGNPIERGSDLEVGLSQSRNELADALLFSKVNRIIWGENLVSPDEICSTAIQHEGIHQGQWHIALKRVGINVPKQWQTDWHLM